MRTAAIVLAAGQGKRMNSNLRKQYMLIKDKPVLFYALQVFEQSFVDEIILVVGEGEESYIRQEYLEKYHFHKISQIVTGGKERYHSVAYGLQALTDCDYVFIHDGARPFVNEDILDRALSAVQEYRACVVGMPVKDTIKIADENGYAQTTPRRDLVWMVQTPQVFEYTLIQESYSQLLEKEQQLREQGIIITDDAMVVETFTNCKVKLVEGSYQNIKITTPEDMLLAERFAEE